MFLFKLIFILFLYMDYSECIEKHTTYLFGHNNTFTRGIEETGEGTYAIYDGLQCTVHFCFYTLSSVYPQFLINADTMLFPSFEYTILFPPLGKNDHDLFQDACMQELFILFHHFDASPPPEDDFSFFSYYKGYIYDKHNVYAFFCIPQDIYVISDYWNNYTWSYIHQICHHTPIILFYTFPQMCKKGVICYGNKTRRLNHPIFGFFYYFIYDNSFATISSPHSTFITENIQRILDTRICRNEYQLRNHSLLYSAFLFYESVDSSFFTSYLETLPDNIIAHAAAAIGKRICMICIKKIDVMARHI